MEPDPLCHPDRREFLGAVAGAAGLLAAGIPWPQAGGQGGPSAPGSDQGGDLRLPAWGPYSKQSLGISHLPELASGVRFDLMVFPSLYRRRRTLPSAVTESAAYAWSALPDLEEYTLRHVLDGLDGLFADVTYQAGETGRTIRVRLSNCTTRVQQVALHLLCGIRYPERGPGRQPVYRPARCVLPPGAVWVSAADYRSLELDETALDRHLPDQANRWGEVIGDGFVEGRGLGRTFGERASDAVSYAVPPEAGGGARTALLRFRARAGLTTTLYVEGAFIGTLPVTGTGGFEVRAVPGRPGAGRVMKIRTAGRGAVELDGFAIVPESGAASVAFLLDELAVRPEIRRGPGELLLSYAPGRMHYGLAWHGEGRVREWRSDDLERDFALYTHDHVTDVFELGSLEHFTEVTLAPLILQSGEVRVLNTFAAHGETRDAASQALARLRERAPGVRARRRAVPEHVPAGDDYAFGVERMAAVLATNVVYPVRRLGRYIRHYTPGRWWDSLYTWDSGFIGLGLLELSPARATDNLAAYLAAPGEEVAFAFHGTPLPVQIYLYQALWNRTHDLALLRRFFAGAARMHRFLVGRGDGSRTAQLGSGLLQTWDYFYNSGGWDDYPPQARYRGTAAIRRMAPAVNSAHAVRTAKILAAAADMLGLPRAEFDEDAARLASALQTQAWNPTSGWFSYVLHDERGAALGPLWHESGSDYNRGFDGISPLVAGICTEAQTDLFLRRLADPAVFWTPWGLSTVDQSAPYFRSDGYWNGAVWFPHQWFIWKSLLDLGEMDLARRVALTALAVWDREVRATGSCFEHFLVSSGRGAGWHQFGGLSSPIVSWFCSYFQPGRLTGGFDCWIVTTEFVPGRLTAGLRFTGKSARAPAVIAVVPDAPATSARWNGSPVAAQVRSPGVFEIRLPAGSETGQLTVG